MQTWVMRPAWRGYMGRLLVTAILLSAAGYAAIYWNTAQQLPAGIYGHAIDIAPPSLRHDVDQAFRSLAAAIPWMLSISGLVNLMGVVVSRHRWKYTISTERVREKRGIVGKREFGIAIPHIRGIEVSRSGIERILGIGTLYLYASGTHQAEVTFRRIAGPVAVREMILQIKNPQRDRSGN